MDNRERKEVFILNLIKKPLSFEAYSYLDFPKPESGNNLRIPHGMTTLIIPDTFNISTLISLINQHSASLIKKPTIKLTQPKPPPRPPNEFMLYRQDIQGRVRSENQHLQNKLISKLIGKMWREESFQVKQTYVTKAQEALKQHQQRYPDYKYRPQPKLLKRSKRKKKPVHSSNLDSTNDNGFRVYDLNLNPVPSSTQPTYEPTIKTSSQGSDPLLPLHYDNLAPSQPIIHEPIPTSSSLPPPIDDTIDHLINHYLNAHPNWNLQPTQPGWETCPNNPWDLFTYQ